MSGYSREDGSAAVTMAVLRAALVAVIFASVELTETRQLGGAQFYAVLGIAGLYALVGIAVALMPSDLPGARALVHAEPVIDVLLLAALAYTSGGAFSDVRKAFFVIPLAAAFSERPRLTANWSLLAVAAFTFQAILAGGHPTGVHNSWPRMTLNQDLYLAWTGAAATALALALRHRTARTEELARSRQRLVTHAIASVERERARLAGALHDSPVQNLIAARHDLRRAERSGDELSFARLHEAIDVTIAQLREEIFNLHPHVLDHVGLGAALDQVARRHAGEREVRLIVDVDPAADRLADRQVLFALGRELLGNAAKHAQATQIRLMLRCGPDCVSVEVVDDGRGIPEGRMRQALLDGHIGLASVSERVSALGGTLTIDTAAGSGTAVSVRLPATTVAPELAPAEISGWVTSHDTLRVSPA
jgi:two-component system, NarL family, sensor kinase